MGLNNENAKLAQHQVFDDETVLLSPGVGYFQSTVGQGSFVKAGSEIGWLRVLGRKFPVRLSAKVPAGYIGEWTVPKGHVEFGQTLLTITEGTLGGAASEEAAGSGQSGAGLCIVAPQPGRIYLKPDPEKPPYVSEGSTVKKGEILLLIEIMKTFTPMHYPGAAAELPESAKILKVLVEDGDEIELGQALFEIEKA